ncbi:hypothetical protein CY34DRAFT_89670, partial [Suillus luteus UH-Slu-Lm8-n1]
PCGYCACSGRPECTIIITSHSNTVSRLTTKCMYQHHFRYRFTDNGSKNKPC